MQVSLGFSPCPNDTFIFDAMVHDKIHTEGLKYLPVMEDVEALNQKAFNGELEVTKLSFHAYGHLQDKYQLLDAGAALGNNVGPLLIAKRELSTEEVNSGRIAIPGKYTTANFLLGLAYPEATNKIEMVFSDIEDAVIHDDVDAGLIIHENRFTYQDKGLVKIIDCGEFWEQNYHLPIPLGGIAVRRDLPERLKKMINRHLKQSVAHAFDHPTGALPFIKAHAQEMDEEVMYKHIDLYVNDYSLDLGLLGKQAVRILYRVAFEKDLIPTDRDDIFLT